MDINNAIGNTVTNISKNIKNWVSTNNLNAITLLKKALTDKEYFNQVYAEYFNWAFYTGS
jgi:hypothetical protein